MRISQFFPGISVILLSFVFSCKEADNSKDIANQLRHPDDYSERINNIFDYVHKIGFDIKFEDCSNTYILQPNLCNVCTVKALKLILDSSKVEAIPVNFILADKNREMELLINKMNEKANIYIDSLNLLEKYNLSFMKNLKINTCNRKVIKW